ncbi:MAG: HAD family phosphatase [Eubacteriales bacterium]|nr:HAD family phosphatase [Eubacteriales bacterium]
MDFRYFIFDLDGTLLDSMGIWDEIDVKYLAKRGIELPADYQQAVTPMETYEIAEYSIRRFGLSDTPEELVAEWREMAGDAYRNTLQIFPFVKETVSLLYRKGIPMAVATSSDHSFAEPALERNGILSMFQAVVTAADVGKGKKSPEIYYRAAELLGAKPEEVWVVEDIPEAIETAANAGFRTMAVFDPESRHSAYSESDISIAEWQHAGMDPDKWTVHKEEQQRIKEEKWAGSKADLFVSSFEDIWKLIDERE